MNYSSNSNYVIINIKYRRGLDREVHHHSFILPLFFYSTTVCYITKFLRRHVSPTSDNCYKLQVTSLTSKFIMCTKSLPYFLSGLVVRGFGRGSKALGIPTANLEDKVVDNLPHDLTTGIYYGWATINKQTYKMVASIGWNPFYKNEKKTVEIHLIHNFENDFYGKQIKAIFTGYIRPEKDFTSEEELIQAIKNDIAVAEEQLQKSDMIAYKNNPFLK